MTARALKSLSPLTVVVGSGGVGKTTVAAALALLAAEAGERCLVMTFDPSLRLKDALGISVERAGETVEVPGVSGELFASLLDARSTFDRLVKRYAPDDSARDRILDNRYYHHLAGSLAGILEYMAVERLYEVHREGGFDRIILDTPPAKQALDFLEAPRRIVSFLDSGVLKIALRRWFDGTGRFKPTARLGKVGNRFERFLDEIVGLDLLRDMAEFFQAFGPLFSGFRERALEVEKLLGSSMTGFTLVAGAGEERNPDTLFFARKLEEAGYALGPVIVNRVHPVVSSTAGDSASTVDAAAVDGRRIFSWLGARDADGLAALRRLLGSARPLIELPLLRSEPSELDSLARVAANLQRSLAATVRAD